MKPGVELMRNGMLTFPVAPSVLNLRPKTMAWRTYILNPTSV